MSNCVAEATKTCVHCKGSGQCDCERCFSSLRAGDPGIDFGDEPDTGRQDEGTCRICEGAGRTTLDDKVIET